MHYSSIENKNIKNLKKLNTKKYRDETNLFLIEGEHLIKEAYKSNCLKEVYILENTQLDISITVNTVTQIVMKYISSLDTPSNMVGVCEKRKQSNIKNKILMLDNIQDPGNVGTIIRSAVAFNIDTIILDNCADVYSSKVLRSSQGMIFNIGIINDNLLNIVPLLKEKDYKILGTKVNKKNNLKTIYKNEKFAIIVGNEGNGVREDILKLCDDFIHIPMNDKCESLNVAVATSIILYELGR